MASNVSPPQGRLPTHHLDDALLLDYATGACGEPEALIIAAHLTLCPECRAKVAAFEEIGGSLLDSLPPEPVADAALDAVLARLDDEEDAAPACAAPAKPQPSALPSANTIIVPAPLRAYLPEALNEIGLDGLGWRSVMRGLDELELTRSGRGAKARLLRIKGGAQMPQHTHEGLEMTLVLTGGFTDERGHFVRGDIAVTDAEVDHTPVADEGEDCICLVVTDARLKLTGRFGRLLNPFVRF